MIEKEKIIEIFEEFKKEKIEGVERELKIEPIKDKAIVIYGPRRSGKSFYLKLTLNEKREETLFIDFEDPRLIGFEINDFFEILELYKIRYGKEPKYIILDEVQSLQHWEKLVRYLISKYFVFVTGSSSKLLSKEIATQLRGRSLSYLLLPFSFKEFLKAKKFNYKKKLFSTSEKVKILNYLEEYFKIGGLPELVVRSQELVKYIKEYLDVVIFRDIVERYKVKEVKILKFIIKLLMESYCKEINPNKIYNTLNSKGIKIRKNTIYEFISYIEDSLFIFLLPKYENSVRLREIYISKSYLMDLVFTNLIANKSITKDMENIVFLHLKRQENQKPFQEIYYYKTNENYEVDFLVKEKNQIKELINVTYANSYEEINEREIRALLHAKEELKLKDNVPLIIITWDY